MTLFVKGIKNVLDALRYDHLAIMSRRVWQQPEIDLLVVDCVVRDEIGIHAHHYSGKTIVMCRTSA